LRPATSRAPDGTAEPPPPTSAEERFGAFFDGVPADAVEEPVPRVRRGRLAAARAVLLYAVTMFAAVTLIFLLPRAMPGDPLSALEDPASGVFITDPEVRERVSAFYGIDGPLHEQYLSYLSSLATGDLGWSIARNAPVSELIARHLPWTLLLVGLALTLSAIISFVAGIVAAWHRNRHGDRVILVGLTSLRSIPEYALATLLLIGFAVLLPVFPLYGARTPFADHPTLLSRLADVGLHLVLPLTALTLSLVGSKFLLVRNTAISSLGEDYMLLARAKGLSMRLQRFRHIGRNALLPFLTVIGIQAGFAVGGAIFVEAVFAYPGMGTLILRAVEARDYPVLEAAFLVLAAAILLANLVIELVYARLDPRAGAQ
jgi:peptide/nickel transport system permease protein